MNDTLIQKVFKIFDLRPSLVEEWFIASDWLEDNNDMLLSHMFRTGSYHREITKGVPDNEGGYNYEDENDYRYEFVNEDGKGLGRGSGIGYGNACGHGDGNGRGGVFGREYGAEYEGEYGGYGNGQGNGEGQG